MFNKTQIENRSTTVLKSAKSILIITILCSILLFGGCMNSKTNNEIIPTILENEDWSPKLDPEIEKQIIKDWLEKYPNFLIDNEWEEMTITHCGTGEGYVAFYKPAGSVDHAITNYILAGTIFRNNVCFEVYLWKDGSFFEMVDAYLQGFITPEFISVIGENHMKYRRQAWNGDDDSFNEYYFNTEDIYTIIP